jgi:hypothetical protein
VKDLKTIFLAAFSEIGVVKYAAIASKIDRKNHYRWMREDPEYPARFRQALTMATETAEDEMRRRALIGVYEPNIFQGRFVYPQEEVEIEPAVLDRKGRVITPARTEWRDRPGAKPLGIYRKSDQMLLAWLRAYKPERYRPAQSVEVTGPDGGPIEIVERLNRARARMKKLAKSE